MALSIANIMVGAALASIVATAPVYVMQHAAKGATDGQTTQSATLGNMMFIPSSSTENLIPTSASVPIPGQDNLLAGIVMQDNGGDGTNTTGNTLASAMEQTPVHNLPFAMAGNSNRTAGN